MKGQRDKLTYRGESRETNLKIKKRDTVKERFKLIQLKEKFVVFLTVSKSKGI